MSDKKVLITGASGFIGAHLWQNLAARGYQVVACVAANSSAQDHPVGQLHEIQLPDEKFSALLAKEKPNFLVHCAGGASVAESFRNPEADFANSVVVTESILAALKQYSPTTKMIFLSSAAVYGNPKELPITTETPTNPISPYGQHKLLCEINCKKYHDHFGIPVTIARIFSVYGPGLKKQILWDIYQKSLQSDTVILHGTGNETRDFIYITDLVNSIAKLLECSEFNANIINIASGKEIAIKDLAKAMLSKLGQSKAIHFNGQERVGDPITWKIDVKQLVDLGIQDGLPVDVGIQNYVNWLLSEACQ